MNVDLQRLKKEGFFARNNMKSDSYIKEIPPDLMKKEKFDFHTKE
jgi:hypothetical protein